MSEKDPGEQSDETESLWGCGEETEYARKLDMLDRLLLRKDPRRPVGAAILHGPEDDLRDLETRVPKADCRIESEAVI